MYNYHFTTDFLEPAGGRAHPGPSNPLIVQAEPFIVESLKLLPKYTPASATTLSYPGTGPTSTSSGPAITTALPTPTSYPVIAPRPSVSAKVVTPSALPVKPAITVKPIVSSATTKTPLELAKPTVATKPIAGST